MIGRLRRAGGMLAILALALLIMPARAGAPERALHVVYVRAGEAQPDETLRAWLARREIAYQVAWIGLAMEINEAELEALAERDDVLLLRAPLLGEPLPAKLEGARTRVWMPVMGQ